MTISCTSHDQGSLLCIYNIDHLDVLFSNPFHSQNPVPLGLLKTTRFAHAVNLKLTMNTANTTVRKILAIFRGGAVVSFLVRMTKDLLSRYWVAGARSRMCSWLNRQHSGFIYCLYLYSSQRTRSRLTGQHEYCQ